MAGNEFNYDVAFSFIYQDEGLALALYNLLHERLGCFIYTEEQKRIAGMDGEKVFNSVFSKESRIVVILYRKEWGTTNWTRIEETAIRNRGYEHGYDFAILIPLDDAGAPEWFPKNRMWIGLNRWGIESAASVIEARAQEKGCEITEVTVADKISLFEKDLLRQKKNDSLIHSFEGRQTAFQEFKALVELFKENVEEIKNKTTNWHLNIRDNKQNGIDLLSYGYQVSIQYYFPNIDDPYLYIAFFDGCFNADGHVDPFNQPQLITFTRYRFNINLFDQKGWSDIEDRENFMATRKLVDYWIEELTKQTSQKRMNNSH